MAAALSTFVIWENIQSGAVENRGAEDREPHSWEPAHGQHGPCRDPGSCDPRGLERLRICQEHRLV